jgi:hypothetical protein
MTPTKIEYERNRGMFIGYMMKRGHFVRSWKRRFFCMAKEGMKMSYFADQESYEFGDRPLGEHQVKIVTHWPQRENGLEIVTRGGKVFYMYGENMDEVERIMKVYRPEQENQENEAGGANDLHGTPHHMHGHHPGSVRGSFNVHRSPSVRGRSQSPGPGDRGRALDSAAARIQAQLRGVAGRQGVRNQILGEQAFSPQQQQQLWSQPKAQFSSADHHFVTRAVQACFRRWLATERLELLMLELTRPVQLHISGVTNVPAESRQGGIQMVVCLARPHPTTGQMQQVSQCRSEIIRASEYSSKNVSTQRTGDPRRAQVNMDMLVTFPEISWTLEAQPESSNSTPKVRKPSSMIFITLFDHKKRFLSQVQACFTRAAYFALPPRFVRARPLLSPPSLSSPVSSSPPPPANSLSST